MPARVRPYRHRPSNRVHRNPDIATSSSSPLGFTDYVMDGFLDVSVWGASSLAVARSGVAVEWGEVTLHPYLLHALDRKSLYAAEPTWPSYMEVVDDYAGYPETTKTCRELSADVDKPVEIWCLPSRGVSWREHAQHKWCTGGLTKVSSSYTGPNQSPDGEPVYLQSHPNLGSNLLSLFCLVLEPSSHPCPICCTCHEDSAPCVSKRSRMLIRKHCRPELREMHRRTLGRLTSGTTTTLIALGASLGAALTSPWG